MSRLILSLASVLVPSAHRAEWMAEWSGELWHIERAGRGGTAFCLGAFRDASWLRRNAPLPRTYGSLLIECQRAPGPAPASDSRLLDSPLRCIAFLGFLAAMSLAIYLLFAIHRVDPQAFGGLLLIAGGACLVVPSATSLSLGDYPGEHHRFRRRLFLAAKIALLFPTVILGGLDLAGASKHFGLPAFQFTFLGVLLGFAGRCSINAVAVRFVSVCWPIPCVSASPLTFFSNGTGSNLSVCGDTGCCTCRGFPRYGSAVSAGCDSALRGKACFREAFVRRS